jgi:hypothetical protein
MSRRYTYERMTAQQFSAALNALEMTKGQFVRLTGAGPRKVERWLAGEEDIPHWILVLCSVLTVPGAMGIAKAVTDEVVQEIDDA